MLPRAICLSLLKARGHLMGMEQLKQLHAQMTVSCLLTCGDTSVVRKLVECYCLASASEGMNFAQHIYKQGPNIFIWNTLIKCAPPEEALLLYAQRGIIETVGHKVVPDKWTFVFVLGACARSLALCEGRQVHSQILRSGFASDMIVQTTGIHFYSSCSDIKSARHLFNVMLTRSNITWNAMIAGYCSQARECNNYAQEALHLSCKMLRGWQCEEKDQSTKPTDTSMVSMLSACSHLGVLATGICFHGYIHKIIATPEADVYIGTSLVDMYSKCGCLTSALKVFNRMKERNIQTWTAMIAGLAFHGRGQEALQLWHAMEVASIRPNAATFTCILCACSHSGLVKEGLHVFNDMSGRFGIKPQIQHYSCIVDLLGRAGLLEEAHKFIMQMPLDPDTVLWRTLLGACKIHGNIKLGEKVGKFLLQLEQRSSTSKVASKTSEDYAALSHIYASSGRWNDVGAIRETMKSEGIRNKPGHSSVHL